MQVHWDHVGEPRNFSTSKFSVGYGTLDLLSGASSSSLRGSHSFFEHDLLPESRSIELSDPSNASLEKREFESAPGTLDLYRPWVTSGILPQTLDVFGDSSLLIVNAPGHLPGHINLLAQTPGGHQVYMAGDAFHDRRLLTGEKSIGEWEDTHGQICCIHADRKQAEETIARLRQLQQQGVEIISAHDPEWENDPANRLRFFGVNQS
jgi:glyoxylase-like metal-dependent hydrolase (beta-lactamase superfamily II)